MDKRFPIFLFVSMMLMMAFIGLNTMLTPPVDDNAEGEVANANGQGGDGQGGDGQSGAGKEPGDDDAKRPADGEQGPSGGVDAQPPDGGVEAGEPDGDGEAKIGEDNSLQPQRTWATVGAFRGAAIPYLAYFSNRGAALERLELVERNKKGRFVYRALEERHGYLGYMALRNHPEGGCLVQVVGPQTPVNLAKSAAVTGGLKPGDVIVEMNGKPTLTRGELDRQLGRLKPGKSVKLTVRRSAKSDEAEGAQQAAEGEAAEGEAAEADQAAGDQQIEFEVELGEKPLVLIGDDDSEDAPPKQASAFTMAINQFRDAAPQVDSWQVKRGESLVTKYWQVRSHDERQLVFATEFVRGRDRIEIEKVFRFTPPNSKDRDPGAQYRFDYSVRARSLSSTSPLIAFRLDGPRGLPVEGWWYLNKIHPRMLNTAGSRDVTWNLAQGGHQIRGTKEIYSKAAKEDPQPFSPIFASDQTAERRTMRYIGIDTSYFNVSMLPADYASGGTMRFASVAPVSVTDPDRLPKKRFKLCDTSFWLATEPVALGSEASKKEWGYEQEFVVFAGPKKPDVLETYGLKENIYYGWFGWVARPLSLLLHFFQAIVVNYGIAIVMLTVFVRACIFPLSRKAARNAQIMQVLGPEMRKIAEKYKDAPEKRMSAQRELYDKYDFNPFGGCGLALLQLPIFMGLYRSISVDIDLRQAELIPGVAWCQNLAAPDMFWEWPLPDFLAAKTAWFGPYLNILPLVTIALFLIQQKLFTPPATDEQTRTQQAMMKYMMIFIGVLFFKVPAGLCIYFIASSIWSIGERKLIPKPDVDLADMERRAQEKKKNGGSEGFLSRTMRELQQSAENAQKAKQQGSKQQGSKPPGQDAGRENGQQGNSASRQRPPQRRRRKK